MVPGHEPEYETYQLVDGTTRERLAKFIHWIGRFKGDHREYQDRMADLEASFKQAIGIKFRRFPVNLPTLHHNIEQVNISRHQAYQSTQVTGPRLALGSRDMPKNAINQESLREEYEDLATQLKRVGLPATISVEPKLGLTGSIGELLTLSVSTTDLYDYAGIARVQKRTFTGEQFRARIRPRGDTAGYRGRFGLLLLDQYSQDNIVEANKQADRPQRLDAIGARIELPIEMAFALYRRPGTADELNPA